MSQPEQYDVLILGSGAGGKLLAWHMAGSGRRTAVVERKWIGQTIDQPAPDMALLAKSGKTLERFPSRTPGVYEGNTVPNSVDARRARKSPTNCPGAS